VQGVGNVSLIPTGWNEAGGRAKLEVHGNQRITTRMGGRAYFAATCQPGVYDHNQYLALDLRGKTLKYTTDLSGAGCGCNAALYLTSLHQNTKPSECGDYYCDANNVCGESCAEIDIQEGNQFSWHSTLHSSQDHSGLGAGYGGGGSGWSGPRDWSGADFGPGGRCIDTKKPFEVSVSFPMSPQESLRAMEVTLTQSGRNCPLSVSIGTYPGMAELDSALAAGMTPIVSYWSDSDMLWMDGKGADGQGPCTQDTPASCAESVSFYGFSVTPAFPPTTPSPEREPTTPSTSREVEPKGPARGRTGAEPTGPARGRGWVSVAAWAFLGGGVTVLALEALLVLGILAFQRLGPQQPAASAPRALRRSFPSAQSLLAMESGGSAGTAEAMKADDQGRAVRGAGQNNGGWCCEHSLALHKQR